MWPASQVQKYRLPYTASKFSSYLRLARHIWYHFHCQRLSFFTIFRSVVRSKQMGYVLIGLVLGVLASEAVEKQACK